MVSDWEIFPFRQSWTMALSSCWDLKFSTSGLGAGDAVAEYVLVVPQVFDFDLPLQQGWPLYNRDHHDDPASLFDVPSPPHRRRL